MKTLLISTTFAAALMSGCVTMGSSSGAVYNQSAAQRQVETQSAIVLAVKQVTIQKENQAAAGLATTIAGAIGAGVGSQVGKSGSIARTVGTVAGGAGGAVAGGMAAEKLSAVRGLEIKVRREDGRQFVVVQEADVDIRKGQCVDITQYNGINRVTPGDC